MKAPAHLRPATAAWWADVVGRWTLEEHHRRLLTLAAEAWDRAEEARERLSDDGGPVYVDRFGAPRKHPSVSIEETARTQFARLVRELNLDDEPPAPPRLPTKWRK